MHSCKFYSFLRDQSLEKWVKYIKKINNEQAFYLLTEIFRQPAKIKKFNRLPTKIENFNRLPTKLLNLNRQPTSGPPIQTLKYSVYEKLPRVFLHRRFLFWREIRPPTPVLLTTHFSAAMKTLVFGNLFKLLRLASTFAGMGSLQFGNKDEDNIYMTIVLFFSLSPTANCPCECDGKSCVNKLPNTRVFIAAEKWMLKSTGVGGLISLQNGNLRR